jgi:hypothetical protein
LDANEVGDLLFGRPCRLALALWIVRRDKPSFFQSEPPRDVIVQSAVAKELSRLVRLGMLEEERRDDSRRVYYHRTSCPLWKIIEAAADVLCPEEDGEELAPSERAVTSTLMIRRPGYPEPTPLFVRRGGVGPGSDAEYRHPGRAG